MIRTPRAQLENSKKEKCHCPTINKQIQLILLNYIPKRIYITFPWTFVDLNRNTRKQRRSLSEMSKRATYNLLFCTYTASLKQTEDWARCDICLSAICNSAYNFYDIHTADSASITMVQFISDLRSRRYRNVV